MFVALNSAVHRVGESISQRSTFSNSSLLYQPRSSSCGDFSDCRSVWDIVWNCLVTIFLCTWVSIHPNVPGPEESPHATAFQHAKTMIMALIAPEMVIAWAMRQLIVARRLKYEFQDQNWTTAHGFFALMGGFRLYHGDKPARTILPKDLRRLVANGTISHLPVITKAEIQDKSKGDYVSKGLVVLQTSWFVAQCCARWAERLPITELEVVTLAYAVLNFVTYFVWWNKPLNVQVPVRVPYNRLRKSKRTLADADTYTLLNFPNGSRDLERDGSIEDMPSASPRAYMRLLRSIGSIRLEGIIYTINYTVVRPFFQMAIQQNAQDSPYYSGTERSDDVIYRVGIPTMVIAAIFGVIHCAAWSFQFPSLAEQILWRISSLAIISLPILLFGITAWLASGRSDGLHSTWIGGGLGLIYILARLCLLVLAGISLRALPAAALGNVHWTSFIPHI